MDREERDLLVALSEALAEAAHAALGAAIHI